MKNILDETPIYEGVIALLEDFKAQLTVDLEALQLRTQKAAAEQDEVEIDPYVFWVKSEDGHERQAVVEDRIALLIENRFPHSPIANHFREYAISNRKMIAFYQNLEEKYPKETDEDNFSSKESFSESLIEEISSVIRFCQREQSQDVVLYKILRTKANGEVTFQVAIRDAIMDSLLSLEYDKKQVDHLYDYFVGSSLVSYDASDDEIKYQCRRLLMALAELIMRESNGDKG